MNTNVKLGFFVAVVILVFMVFTLNITRGLFRPNWKTYFIDFQNISTLEIGAPVKQAGYTIGDVTDIRPFPVTDKNFVVRVEISVKPNSPISEDSVGDIISLGMMGEKYIELSYGSGSPAPDKAILQGRDPFDMMSEGVKIAESVDKLLKTFNEYVGKEDTQLAFHAIVENVSSISRAISELVAAEEGTIRDTLLNIKEASDHLRDTLYNADALVAEASQTIISSRPAIHSIIDNASASMEVIHRDIVTNAAVASRDFKVLSQQMLQLLDRLDRLIAKHEPTVDRTVTNVEELTVQAKDTLGKFDPIVTSLDHTSKDIEGMVRHVNSGGGMVGRLIRDATWESAADTVIRGASETVSAIRNWPDRFGFYYDIRYFDERERFSDDENNMRNDLGIRYRVNDDWFLWLGANDVGTRNGFEAQVGWNYGPFTLRGGVMESEMAVGADIHVYDWITFELDGIGLTEEEKERFDAHALIPIRVIDGVYLYGGVQDIGEENFANIGAAFRY